MRSVPEIIKSKSSAIFGRDPYRDLFGLQRQMDNLFSELWNSNGINGLSRTDVAAPFLGVEFAPSADLDETESHYLLSFDIPGMKKEDIKIDARENMITVSGERKEEFEEKKKSSYQSERFWGGFSRSISLPQSIKTDQIEAQYSDGVLRVAVPKAEVTKVKQIKIGEGKSGFLDKFKSGSQEKH